MSEHPLVQLARRTIETYVRESRVIDPPPDPTPEMRDKAGVFVSLHRQGKLRGCIGTFGPTMENVAKEVIRNAVQSSTQDPRFPPVRPDELADLEISVDVLTDPIAVKSEKELDAKKYGVIVKSGTRSGLLLPDLPGVNTAAEQIAICRRKAWINDDEPVELYKFEVRRFH